METVAHWREAGSLQSPEQVAIKMPGVKVAPDSLWPGIES